MTGISFPAEFCVISVISEAARAAELRESEYLSAIPDKQEGDVKIGLRGLCLVLQT